jgi:hypothetical protein
MTSIEMNQLLTKMNRMEEMMRFDNRKKRGIICGTIFGLSCNIKHYHTNDNEKWDGSIPDGYSNNMVGIVVELKNINIYEDVYLNLIINTPNITPDMVEKLLEDNGDTTADLNILSVYKYVYDYVFDYHFMEKFKNHPTIGYVGTTVCGEEIGLLVRIKQKTEYYIDTLIMDIYSGIGSIFNVGLQQIKNISIWSDDLPEIFKYIAVKLSDNAEQELNNKLENLRERDKEPISNVYKNNALDCEVFSSGMCRNRPYFVPDEY